MEAAALRSGAPANELPGEKAARIVEAMRASVAVRGIAGSTFDHVAREAGVSRGLLHYYFQTKERLLVEVVRRESQVRGELLDQAVAGARNGDDLIDALVRSFEDLLADGSSGVVMFYELLTLPSVTRRSPASLRSWPARSVSSSARRCAGAARPACSRSAANPTTWPASCSFSLTGS